MAPTTAVSIVVGVEDNEEARRALWSLVTDHRAPFGPLQVWRSEDQTTITVHLPGDVRTDVQAQLANLSALDYTVRLLGS